jgi:hypothetical protein
VLAGRAVGASAGAELDAAFTVEVFLEVVPFFVDRCAVLTVGALGAAGASDANTILNVSQRPTNTACLRD